MHPAAQWMDPAALTSQKCTWIEIFFWKIKNIYRVLKILVTSLLSLIKNDNAIITEKAWRSKRPSVELSHADAAPSGLNEQKIQFCLSEFTVMWLIFMSEWGCFFFPGWIHRNMQMSAIVSGWGRIGELIYSLLIAFPLLFCQSATLHCFFLFYSLKMPNICSVREWRWWTRFPSTARYLWIKRGSPGSRGLQESFRLRCTCSFVFRRAPL